MRSIDSLMIKSNATNLKKLSILDTTCSKIIKIQAIDMRPFTGERRGSNWGFARTPPVNLKSLGAWELVSHNLSTRSKLHKIGENFPDPTFLRLLAVQWQYRDRDVGSCCCKPHWASSTIGAQQYNEQLIQGTSTRLFDNRGNLMKMVHSDRHP
jgi:hypothetical protein